MAVIGGIVVEIGGDTSDLKKSLGEAKTDLKGFDSSVGGTVKNIGELRMEYKKLSKESLVGKSPQEVEAMNRRLATLRDAVGDADAKIKSLSLDPFQKMAESVKVASTAMAGLAGVSTLFGGSQEEMQKLMQKTVALIAIAQAAQEAADFTKQRAAGIWLKTKTLEIAARIKEALTINAVTASAVAEGSVKAKGLIITKAITAAQWLWNAAIAANPIGILIAGVAALGVGVYAAVKALKSQNTELDNAKAKIESLNVVIEKKGRLDKNELELTSALGASEQELDAMRLTQINEELARQEELIASLRVISSKRRMIGGKTTEAKKASEELATAESKLKDIYQEQNIIFAKRTKADLDEKKVREAAAKKAAEEEKKAREAARAEIQKGREVAITDFRKYIEAINREAEKIEPIDVEIDWGETKDFVPKLLRLVDATQMVSEALSGLAVDATVAFAETLGAVAAGGAGMADVFKAVLSTVGDFLGTLGKALIASGVGSIKFRQLLFTPGAAIAAGAALVALSGFVKAKLGAGPGGGGGASVPSAPRGGGGGYAGGVSGSRGLYGTQPLVVTVSGELKAKGGDLVAVISSENIRRSI